MQNIHFNTPTLIDPRFLSLFGVSIKDDPNAIGQFGTGIKHGISVSLRDNLNMQLHSMRDSVVYVGHFETSEDQLRGQTIELVQYHELNTHTEEVTIIDLPFATNMSRAWASWMAVRELYSNTLDEHGTVGVYADAYNDPVVEEGCTVITMDLSQEQYDEACNNILPMNKATTEVFTDRALDVLTCQSEAGGIYVRGMRVRASGEGDNVIINIHDASEFRNMLSEERLLKARWAVDDYVCNVFDCALDDAGVDAYKLIAADATLARILTQRDRLVYRMYIGHGIDANQYAIHLRDSVRIIIKAQTPEEVLELTVQQRAQLGTAMAAFNKIGFAYPKDTTFRFVDNAKDTCMAETRGNTVVLFPRAFDGGMHGMLKVLLEEYTHIKHGVSDYTVEQQHVYLDMIIQVYNAHSGDWL